jgi:hypothetical protein
MRSFGADSARAIAARNPAPPAPTMTTSLVSVSMFRPVSFSKR